MRSFRRWLLPVLSIAAPPALAASITHADAEALAERGVELARSTSTPLSGLSIAASGGTPSLLLREIRICIDDIACARFEYNVDQGRALASGALHLLPIEDVTAGTHRLQADVTAVDPAAPPYSPRTRAKIDTHFDRSASADTTIELHFGAASLTHAAELVKREIADPQSIAPRAAQFLLIEGNVFEAAAISPRTTIAPATAPDAQVDPWLLDRQSIALGEQLLSQHRNEEAAKAFRLVRSPGPFANRALLELGWTRVLPAADASTHAARPASYALPSSPDAIAQTRRQTPFRYLSSIATGARADDLRAALSPWMELIGRDPFDPAVQEGLLAVPYALAHLGAQQQSIEYAERAITQLDAAHQLLDRAAKNVESELIPFVDAYLDDERDGWHEQFGALAPQKRWWLGDAPEPNYYAGVLLDDPDFVALLDDYRTLHQLLRFLGRSDQPMLRADAESARESLRDQLKVRAASDLAARSRGTANELAEANLWIARLRDRTPQQVTAR